MRRKIEDGYLFKELSDSQAVAPFEELGYEDCGYSYEWDICHIVRDAKGDLYSVAGSGCSCYGPDDGMSVQKESLDAIRAGAKDGGGSFGLACIQALEELK